MKFHDAHPLLRLRSSFELRAELRAFLKRPYPARGRVIGPGFDHTFPPESRPMNALSADLLVRILTLATRLASALGAADADHFFRSLIEGVISPQEAAAKAANALALSVSVALDVGQLGADLAALQLAFTTESAVAAMNQAIDFGDGTHRAAELDLTDRARAQLADMLATMTEPTTELPDGSIRLTAAEYERLMEIVTAPPAPSPALAAVLSAKTEQGFAALEQEAQGATEEGTAAHG